MILLLVMRDATYNGRCWKTLALDILHVIQRLCSDTARTTEQPLPNSWFSIHFGLRGEKNRRCSLHFLEFSWSYPAENKRKIHWNWLWMERWFISLKDWPLFQRTFVNKNFRGDFHLRNLPKKIPNMTICLKGVTFFQTIILGIQPLVFLGENMMYHWSFTPVALHDLISWFSSRRGHLAIKKVPLFIFGMLAMERTGAQPWEKGGLEVSKRWSGEVESESWRCYCVLFNVWCLFNSSNMVLIEMDKKFVWFTTFTHALRQSIEWWCNWKQQATFDKKRGSWWVFTGQSCPN